MERSTAQQEQAVHSAQERVELLEKALHSKEKQLAHMREAAAAREEADENDSSAANTDATRAVRKTDSVEASRPPSQANEESVAKLNQRCEGRRNIDARAC